jgi:glycosyltransferase involved in cell wall biosynthesis
VDTSSAGSNKDCSNSGWPTRGRAAQVPDAGQPRATSLPVTPSANDGAPGTAPAPDSAAAGAAVVAVVVLADTDIDRLDCCLDALDRQDLDAPFDVLVVVDDADDHAVARLVAAWSTRLLSERAHYQQRQPDSARGVRLRYLPDPGKAPGPASARNLGWRATHAPVIAFIGADTVPAPDFLRQGLAAFEAAIAADPVTQPTAPPTVDAVFGLVQATMPRNPTETQLDSCLRDGAGFSPCNWFCRRATLAQLGGFDERFNDLGGEMEDFHMRLLAAKAHIVRAPAAVVAHPATASSWGASLDLQRELGTQALLLKKHAHLYRKHLYRPPPPLWHDLAVLAALVLTVVGWWLHHEVLTVAAGGTWMVLTGMLIIRRLLDTAKTASHIAEVILTSLVLPPLALFWRLVGAARFHLRFARA